MKQRVISAVILAIIAIPLFIIGGYWFNIAFYIVGMLGLREFLKVKKEKKEFPDAIQFISYLMFTLLYFTTTLNSNLKFAIDFKIVSAIFLFIFMPVVFYHDDKAYNSKDAFHLLGGVFFLGTSMTLFYTYRSISLALIAYLLLITIITDSFALYVGSLIGKNKLCKSISPNKTWEGSIGGSLVGTFVATAFYHVVVNSAVPIYQVAIITLILTIVGQIGDLFFSAIKRNYGVKDFSNIMPGHGGVLDRLDSIIFVMVAFTFFIAIMG